MPSTYAHYRFGNMALKHLPNNLIKIIESHRSLYDIGVHGPDYLFYYEPYHHNPTSSYGFKMHDKLASDFFKKARIAYANHEEKEAMLAYILGFVSHFSLDYTDHSYVEIKETVSKVSHGLIETEYDRHLLIKDGLNPFKEDPVKHIHPTYENAKIIAYFFDDIGVKKVEKALRGMVFYLRLLKSSSDMKRSFLNTSFKAINQYDSLSSLVMKKEADERCLDSNLRLDKLEPKALELFIALANNMYAYLNGQADLDERFYKTFSYQPNYKEIPVYSLNKEKEYEI